MHELSVTQGILDFAIEQANARSAKKIVEVKIALGALAGLVPDCIDEYFALLAENTVAKGAKLSFRKINAKVSCKDCGKESEIHSFRLICPECRSRRVDLLSGKEAYIESIEIEE